ncbi:hypothetical protein ABXN37_18220 [Piscinibacter sakaiensis]|uniref:hypothetical protein n=1 Tax=Piscinibacter sakaiensis TaxID=1547922 RepID=UPI0037266B7B
MFKSLRVPEKLFAAGMWLLSFAFAGFLVGLGSQLVADLPRLDEPPTVEQFADAEALAATRAAQKRLAADDRRPGCSARCSARNCACSACGSRSRCRCWRWPAGWWRAGAAASTGR